MVACRDWSPVSSAACHYTFQQPRPNATKIVRVNYDRISIDIKSKLAVQDSYAVNVCGTDFAAFIRKQYEETGRTIREANFTAQ